ncbi:hypothetical protein H1R20_g14601, partial [Candolleomyces eurysporus]
MYTSWGKAPSRHVSKWLKHFSTRKCDSLPFELVLESDHYTWPKINEVLSIASSTVTSLNLYLRRSAAMLALLKPIQFAGIKSGLGPQPLISWDRLEKLTLALHVEGTRSCGALWPPRSIQNPETEVMAPMPRLTHLILQSFTRSNGPLATMTFPWAQLVSLEIGQYLSEPEGILRVLQRCSALEDCRLHLYGVRWWQFILGEGHLSLPRLRRLAVLADAWYDHDHLFEWILAPLFAPALEYLELRIGDLGKWVDLGDVLNFIRRSSVNLRHLVLQNVQVAEDMFTSFLKSAELQSLEILTVLNFLPQLVSFLEYGAKNPDVLPHLQVLDLTLSRGRNHCVLREAFDHFVAARVLESHLADGCDECSQVSLRKWWLEPCVHVGWLNGCGNWRIV